MDKRRRWMAVIIEEALQADVLAPDDVLRHVTPSVLATDLPPELVASVLQAGLSNDSFDTRLIVETIGSEQMAEHLPLPLLWSCADEAAQTIIREHPGDQKAQQSSESAEEPAGADVPPGEMVAEETAEIEVLEE